MLPKARLGKRSPFGALVSSTCPAAGTQTGQETGETAAGQQACSRVKGHPGLKVRSWLPAFKKPRATLTLSHPPGVHVFLF